LIPESVHLGELQAALRGVSEYTYVAPRVERADGTVNELSWDDSHGRHGGIYVQA